MKRNFAFLVLTLVPGVILAQNKTPAEQSPAEATDTSTKTGVFHVGMGVKPPRATYAPDPIYPKQARKPRGQNVVLWVVVGLDGVPHRVGLVRSLSPEFDEAAMDAVKKWKFDPATKDGQPVTVKIQVEVSFKR